MNIQRKICALLFTVLLLSPMYALAGRVDVVHVVQWLGVGLPVSLPEGVGGDTVPAGTPCYEVPMVIPNTSIRIGSGYDCITNAGSLLDTGNGTVTTYYIFAFRGQGSIVSQNRVVVRAASDDDELNPISGDESPVNEHITHILGSFPSKDTIVDGARRFRNAKGRVRVSGAVSLANFPNEIVFDDLFIIDTE